MPGDDQIAARGVVETLRNALSMFRCRGGDVDLPEDVSQELMHAAVKSYTRAQQRDPSKPAADPHEVTATQVAVTASALLRAQNIELFELAMWQTQEMRARTAGGYG